MTFADEIETAKTEIAHLEEAGADVVIAVAHMEMRPVERTVRRKIWQTG